MAILVILLDSDNYTYALHSLVPGRSLFLIREELGNRFASFIDVIKISLQVE